MVRSLLVLLLVVGCTKVEPGYVGIKVNQFGTQKGVEDFPLVVGRVTFNPFTTDIYKFPTFRQNVIWNMADGDESVTFNSNEGSVINADVGLSYSIIPERVPDVFIEFRKPIDEITDIYLRAEVRDSIARNAGRMGVIEIFGTRRQELLTGVEDDLNERLGPIGFHFEMVSFIGALRCDESVMRSINATIEATQFAISAQNKIVQTEAEAAQKVATARGNAESLLIEAEAQARANIVLAESITPELVQWKALEKWNGVQPQVLAGEGGIMPMVRMND